MTTNTLRSRFAVRVSNWLLRTFAPEYSRFIGGAVEYGMCAAARDAVEGRDLPPDWRLRALNVEDPEAAREYIAQLRSLGPDPGLSTRLDEIEDTLDRGRNQ